MEPPPPLESKTERQASSEAEPRLFGFQDLASDYYQVLRQKSRPRKCRMIWGVVVVFLFICTSYMVFNLLRAYFRYGSFNLSSTEWVESVELPAITICSTNFINYTSLRTSLESQNETEVLELFTRAMDFLENFDRNSDFMETAKLEQYQPLFEYEREVTSLVLNFSLDVSNMLAGTPHYFFQNFGHYISDPAEAVTRTELGLCLNINDDGVLKQSHGGSKNGFTIDLNTNLKDYLPTTSTDGFVLFLRDHNEVLFMDEGGYVIGPGTETFVKLTSKTIKRLGHPHGTCKKVESRFREQSGEHSSENIRECWQRQEIQTMIKMCRCIPVYFAEKMVHSNKTHVLDEAIQVIQTATAELNANDSSKQQRLGSTKRTTSTEDGLGDIKEWDKLSFMNTPYYNYACGLVLQAGCKVYVESMISRGELELEKCAEPCQYHEWDAGITSSPFPPTRTYFNKFLKSGKVPTFEDARENLARLHVYYDEIRIQKTEQKASYSIYNFIAEFGGTVDLFIGFSFFTVFQLIEIGIASCFIKCCRRNVVDKEPRPMNGEMLQRNREMLQRSLENCSIKLSGME